MRCKYLMGVANLCKCGVSQFNGDGYNPRSGKKIPHSFVLRSLTKIAKENTKIRVFNLGFDRL
jgi:hypothetical protein